MTVAILAVSVSPAFAQSPETFDLTTVGKDSRWKIAGHTTSIVEIKGKRAVHLNEAEGMGIVWLE